MPTQDVHYAVGDRIDSRYELRRDIGVGAVGRVFEAVHLFTGRSVALKLVASEVPPGLRTSLRVRLAREARALAGLRHPNIVQALDGGTLDDGTPYLVMELLEGRTLEGLIAARGQLTIEDTVAVGLQLSDALLCAHAAGIVHRDVKPSNAIVVQRGDEKESVVLVDFGIVRIAASDDDRLTHAGGPIGTPAYMAPEQLLAKDDVDDASDVYSLGVTLFECLAGGVPYEGNHSSVLLQVCSPTPTPDVRDLRSDVPAALADAIRRAMERPRETRIPLEELRALLAGIAARERTVFQSPPAARSGGREQRLEPRTPYATPARLLLDGATIDGRTEDISTRGLLFICRRPCQVGGEGILRFALPIEGRIASAAVAVRWARAAHPASADGPRAVGLQFLSPENPCVPSIARFVELMKAR